MVNALVDGERARPFICQSLRLSPLTAKRTLLNEQIILQNNRRLFVD